MYIHPVAHRRHSSCNYHEVGCRYFRVIIFVSIKFVPFHYFYCIRIHYAQVAPWSTHTPFLYQSNLCNPNNMGWLWHSIDKDRIIVNQWWLMSCGIKDYGYSEFCLFNLIVTSFGDKCNPNKKKDQSALLLIPTINTHKK